MEPSSQAFKEGSQRPAALRKGKTNIRFEVEIRREVIELVTNATETQLTTAMRPTAEAEFRRNVLALHRDVNASVITLQTAFLNSFLCRETMPHMEVEIQKFGESLSERIGTFSDNIPSFATNSRNNNNMDVEANHEKTNGDGGSNGCKSGSGVSLAELRQHVLQQVKGLQTAELLELQTLLLSSGVALKHVKGSDAKGLSVDEWSTVLQFLNVQDIFGSFMPVCRSWFVLASDDMCWNARQNVSVAGACPPQTQLPILFSRLKSLKKLHVSCDEVDTIVGQCVSYCRLVDHVDVTHTMISDAGIASLSKCDELHNLCLKACKDFSDAAFSKLLETTNHLHILNILGTNLSDAAFVGAAAHLQHVRVLDVGFTMLQEPSFKEIAQLSQLEHLDMYGCEGLMDEVIRILGEGIPLLKKLDLGCTSITDKGLTYMSTLMRSLVSLGLHDCLEITDYGLGEIARNLHHLKRLDIGETSITDVGIEYLARSSSQLEELIIWYCDNISDRALQVISQSLTSLRLLDIGSPNITDVGLKFIGNLTRLETVEMYGSDSITDVGVIDLASRAMNLRRLNIGDTKITDMSLAAISTGLPHLEHLQVRDCENLTERGLASLRAGLRVDRSIPESP